MDKLPYFPLYVLDIQADEHVDVMSTLEFGAYMRLLIKAWHQEPCGTVPDDDLILAKWSRLTITQWKKARPAVAKAFVTGSDGRLHQKRMKKEFAKFKKRSESASANASKRWEGGNADAMPNGCDGNATASNPHPIGNARAYDSEYGSGYGSGVGGPGEGVGWIVREWFTYARGHVGKLRDHEPINAFFVEMLRRGISESAIVEKIKEPKRDRSQTHWDFAKQYFPSAKPGKKSRPGDPGYYDGIASANLDDIEAKT